MSADGSWNKQEWIKDVLSKSGTDIVEIKDEKTSKESCKMVYYPALPLIIKSETKEQQLCTQLSADTQVYQNALNHHQQPQQQHHSHHHQQQQQHHHQPTSNNVISSNQTTLLVTQGQSFLSNIKVEQQQLSQQQQQQPQQPQLQQIHVQQSTTPITNHQSKFHFKCDQCDMIFGSKSAHTSHMKSHSAVQDNNYQPAIGPPGIPNNGQPTTTGSSSDPYQCDVCKKTFAVPARLSRHYRTHTGERPFECEFCHKMFSVKENLQVHRRIHTKERPYKCDVCGRAFEHSGKLHRHMRIHTGERPHKCSVCDKTFIQSGQLVIHMRTHTGEKPYKCPVEGCGKGFTCSKQLKVHSRTHTGEKPYHCDICFRDFGYNHVLKLHRVQHYGSKCYKCTICDETFKSKKEMEAHIKGHANEIPDEDEESPSQTQITNNSIKQENNLRYVRDQPVQPEMEKSRDSITTTTSASSIMMETPRESSSEPTSDNGEDAMYYNMYQRFDQQQNGLDFSIHHQNRPSINPALLAAASIASRRVVDEQPRSLLSVSSLRTKLSSPVILNITSSSGSPSSSIAMDTDTSIISSNDIEIGVNHKQQQQLRQQQLQQQPQQPQPMILEKPSSPPHQFVYEPLAVMRQHGYFAPAPVAEFRPSLRSANDIVRRVEAAIAGAEPLLTPPRSSTESPDRSSSPESDSMMMADRDVMTLPLRKRKLYLKDNQSQDVPPTVRMSSVIQFAKAS